MRRIISLLAVMAVIAAMAAASAIPAFAQGPPPDRPPEASGPPLFAKGPPEGAAEIMPCAGRGVAVTTPSGNTVGKCVER